MYEAAAEESFKIAREIYTGKDRDGNAVKMSVRYKSSNKLHLDSASIMINDEFIDEDVGLANENAAYKERLANADDMHGKDRVAFKMKGNFIEQGMLLQLSKTQALNCWELAAIAARVAYVKLGKGKGAVSLGGLASPADHAFTIIGERALVRSMVEGKKVDDLRKIARKADLYITDPWLNICRHASKYPDAVYNKLEKWHRNNKRVYWGSGPVGSGWYTPKGDYRDGFLDATIEVSFAS